MKYLGIQHFLRCSLGGDAVINENHLIGIAGQHGEVVSGHQNGKIVGFADFIQHVHQGLHTFYVHTGERLVQNQNIGQRLQRKSQQHPLQLTAGEGANPLVDQIGGVQFDIPMDMDYDDPYQNLHIHLKKGPRLLNGQEAMEVVRWRKNNDNSGHSGTDVERLAIQQDFLKAMIKQTMTPANVLNIGKLSTVFQESVETDLSFQEILWFGQQAVSGGLSVENVEFFCGDAGEIAKKLSDDGIRPDVICVDPPRKGLAPGVTDTLADMNPRRIVYVSCDPATLARDVALLKERGYTLKNALAADLFPRCSHVESVVCLSREKADDCREEPKTISDERSKYKSWSNLKKQMNDLLCDSLKDKISYFYTSYHEVHNAYGRATINYNKKEMVAFSWVEMYAQEREVSQLYQEGKKVSYGELEKGKWIPECKLCDADFINSLTIYLKTDIAISLHSDNYLLRVFAYMDRRVGKRTLIKIKDDVEKLPDWVKQFYQIRCEADGIVFPPKQITDESIVCLCRQ